MNPSREGMLVRRQGTLCLQEKIKRDESFLLLEPVGWCCPCRADVPLSVNFSGNILRDTSRDVSPK